MWLQQLYASDKMRLVDELVGKEIITERGNVLGKVADIELDTANNSLTSLILIKEEKKRFKSSTTKSEIPFEKIKSIKDKVMIEEDFNLESYLYE